MSCSSFHSLFFLSFPAIIPQVRISLIVLILFLVCIAFLLMILMFIPLLFIQLWCVYINYQLCIPFLCFLPFVLFNAQPPISTFFCLLHSRFSFSVFCCCWFSLHFFILREFVYIDFLAWFPLLSSIPLLEFIPQSPAPFPVFTPFLFFAPCLLLLMVFIPLLPIPFFVKCVWLKWGVPSPRWANPYISYLFASSPLVSTRLRTKKYHENKCFLLHIHGPSVS